jgi:hypothetical protein
MYLVGRPMLVRTDHAALKCFNTQPKLTQRQARWSISMQEQDVTFIHLPGQANVVADTLSRRPDLEANAIQLRKRKQSETLLELGEEVYRDTSTELLAVGRAPPPSVPIKGGHWCAVAILVGLGQEVIRSTGIRPTHHVARRFQPQRRALVQKAHRWSLSCGRTRRCKTARKKAQCMNCMIRERQRTWVKRRLQSKYLAISGGLG